MPLQRPILQMIRRRPCCCGWPGAPGCTVRQASGQGAGAYLRPLLALTRQDTESRLPWQPGSHGSPTRRTRPMPMPATGCAVRRPACAAEHQRRSGGKPCPVLRKGRAGGCLFCPEGRRAAFAARLDGLRPHQRPGRLHGVAAGPAFRCGCACCWKRPCIR